VYHHQALAGVLVRDRAAGLRQSAKSAQSAQSAQRAAASARGTRTQHRPGVIASARLRTGWLLVDMGLRLAVPRRGANPPVASGRR
jgi:hypothetical protein